MDHIRLGTLSRSKKWREVVEILGSNASLEAVAEASARASELDLARASNDPSFQFISKLLVELPLIARSPGFYDSLEDMGFASNATDSVSKLLSEVSNAIDRNAFDLGQSSDLGALAQSTLLETLSIKLREGLPSLFASEPLEIRRASGSSQEGRGLRNWRGSSLLALLINHSITI